jgi:uncharacterized protein YjdB
VEVLAPVTALPVGRTTLLAALVRNQQGNPMTAAVTWQSAAPGVATVDAGGTVTAVAPGSAVVTATAGSAEAMAASNMARKSSRGVMGRSLP